jgi:hypothetical protein
LSYEQLLKQGLTEWIAGNRIKIQIGNSCTAFEYLIEKIYQLKTIGHVAARLERQGDSND